MGATSAMETSFAMIAALVAMDAPRQIGWHLEGAMRNGATKEEVRAVRAIAMRISKATGIVWKEDIPDI
jgi:alkylhydroperoxidase/carboxymuconolactone decarboxylase family protein YurZ